MRKKECTTFIAIILFTVGCSDTTDQKKAENSGSADTTKTAANQEVNLPAPYATKSSQNFSKVIGWPQGKTPLAPQGFAVTKFADGFNNPRWIYVAPNGDIFVAEANTEQSTLDKAKSMLSGKSSSQNLGNSSNRITLLRYNNNDGIPDSKTVFLTGLNQPFGMLVLGNSFYVANTDALYRFPYTPGDTSVSGDGKKILDLPAGGYNNHWTRNLIASKDGAKIFISVGSGSNVGENGMDNEVRRANILQINPDGSGEKVFASGLRNPVGMGWAPGTSTLWTAVNERDELGDELVPDYITSIKEGGFYGWPYAYFGAHEDPRVKGLNPEMVKKAMVPDVALGAHTASLGLAFDEKAAMPGKYKGGAFIGQHGSWNRSQLSGYRVVFVPFANGKATGTPEDFLTGFVANGKSEVYGRPVGVAFTKDGAMLVADDASNTIWRVAPVK
ncbi:MAG TPA: sorbosone dehydrogenase family protein [Chitinophagaceae bacterium]|nr:sorbosone dehydrogenase family protein [Chitinophagaceae bacterium]